MASFDRRANFGGRSRQVFPRSAMAALPRPEASQARIHTMAAAPTISLEYRGGIKIENVEYVASFNWKDTRDPTVIIPGKPPRWQPPAEVQSLAEDSGSYHRDPNSARFPSFPTEPAIRAICETIPDFDFSEIGVFGCGNTIGSLLSFASGEERTFRFGVELIGPSLFLVRKTNKPRELINDVRGYGHTFPEAYTQWDRHVRNSASHQRIIKYDFAGLKCFVRSETDGYLPDLINETSVLSEELVEDDHAPDPGQLLGVAIGLHAPSAGTELTLTHAGEAVPQRAVFDLKTRALKNQDVSVQDFLHRLWVNQTPNMILAYHSRGKFLPNNIHIVDVKDKVAEWERSNIATLSKLGGMLRKLIEIAKQGDRRYFEVRRIGSGPLEIWSEVPSWSALPDDLKRLMGVSVLRQDLSNQNSVTRDAEEDQESEDDEADYLRF